MIDPVKLLFDKCGVRLNNGKLLRYQFFRRLACSLLAIEASSVKNMPIPDKAAK